MERIEEIRERASKATPGPIKYVADGKGRFVDVNGSTVIGATIYGVIANDADIDFYAHAREDNSFLLDMVDRLTAALAAVARTPENKPLTREQIGEMPRMSAVWMYFSEKWDPRIMSARAALLGMEDNAVFQNPPNSIFFAAPPTSEDIRKAREAHAHPTD